MILIRPTQPSDLDRVLEIERDPANTPFIGQWSPAEHLAAIERADRFHCAIERAGDARGQVAGYLIAYDLSSIGLGIFVKRIAVEEKSRGVGRAALARFVEQVERERAQATGVVWLTVFADNARAQRAYAALDFRVLDLTSEARRFLHDAVGGFSAHSLVMSRGGVALPPR